MTLSGVEHSTFVPPLQIQVTQHGTASCSHLLLSTYTYSPLPAFRSYRRFQPTARITNGLPAYRAALLTGRDKSAPTPTLEKQSSTLTKTAAPARQQTETRLIDTAPETTQITTAPTPQKTERRETGTYPPDQDSRYRVRMAEEGELYTVADIRCDAFYGYPKDPCYYPVRRREIYMAMRDRIDSGNKCLVIVDTQPPCDYHSFANNGELVVGSLDVSLHKASSGRRCRFDNAITETEQDGRRIYLSSMAVREEWQGRGLAQRLLAQVDAIAHLYGIMEVFLHVEWDNAPAVHVYRKCGFKCVKKDSRVPRWLHFLAKQEHTLMRKIIK